jgi:hypothetical protein
MTEEQQLKSRETWDQLSDDEKFQSHQALVKEFQSFAQGVKEHDQKQKNAQMRCKFFQNNEKKDLGAVLDSWMLKNNYIIRDIKFSSCGVEEYEVHSALIFYTGYLENEKS